MSVCCSVVLALVTLRRLLLDIILLIVMCPAAEPLYRLLHISVAAAFAQQLQLDSAALKDKRLGDISLAAKWAPTPASKLLCEALMKLYRFPYGQCKCFRSACVCIYLPNVSTKTGSMRFQV